LVLTIFPFIMIFLLSVPRRAVWGGYWDLGGLRATPICGSD
jgi:hypothetical protein